MTILDFPKKEVILRELPLSVTGQVSPVAPERTFEFYSYDHGCSFLFGATRFLTRRPRTWTRRRWARSS